MSPCFIIVVGKAAFPFSPGNSVHPMAAICFLPIVVFGRSFYSCSFKRLCGVVDMGENCGPRCGFGGRAFSPLWVLSLETRDINPDEGGSIRWSSSEVTRSGTWHQIPLENALTSLSLNIWF